MKVKDKAKQLFCMVCAFVASFLVTVTAFADFTIYTPALIGHYEATENTSSFIDLYESKMVLKAYYVGDGWGYVVASSSDGSIDYARYGLNFDTGYCCQSNGKLTGAIASDFTIQGTTHVNNYLLPTKITLTPKNKKDVYILEK